MSRFRKFGTLVGLEEDNVIPEAGDQNVDNVPEIAGLQAEKALNDVDETCQAGECLVTDVNTVNNVQNLIKEKAAEGEGIPQATAEVVDVVMESIYTRWGMGRRYSDLRRKYSLEDYVEQYEIKDDDNFFTKVWRHIANFFIRIWNGIMHIIGIEDGPLAKVVNVFIDTLLVKIRHAKGLETIAITETNKGGKTTVDYSHYCGYIDDAGKVIEKQLDISFTEVNEVITIFQEKIFGIIETYNVGNEQECVVFLEKVYTQYNILISKLEQFSLNYTQRETEFNKYSTKVTEDSINVTGIDKGWYEKLDTSLTHYEEISKNIGTRYTECNNKFVKLKQSLEKISAGNQNFYNAELYIKEEESAIKQTVLGVKAGNAVKGVVTSSKKVNVKAWFTGMVAIMSLSHKHLKGSVSGFINIINYFNKVGMKTWF